MKGEDGCWWDSEEKIVESMEKESFRERYFGLFCFLSFFSFFFLFFLKIHNLGRER